MEDRDIIELFWIRNEQAITETDQKYGKALHSLSDKIVENYEDAQECVNDTYHKAWTHIPPARPDFFFAYLAKIARHLSFGKLDYHHAQKRNAIIVELSTELENCISAPDAYEQKTTSEEIAKVINQFLAKQTVEMRKVFVRRYWYMNSVSEISTMFSISESKVKSILFRMRNKLRRELEMEGLV